MNKKKKFTKKLTMLVKYIHEESKNEPELDKILKNFNFQFPNFFDFLWKSEDITEELFENPTPEVKYVIADRKSAIPNRCPVCNGTGTVPYGFYLHLPSIDTTTVSSYETCRQCRGEGLIWSE